MNICQALPRKNNWIPAYAGMTELGNRLHSKWNQIILLLMPKHHKTAQRQAWIKTMKCKEGEKPMSKRTEGTWRNWL